MLVFIVAVIALATATFSWRFERHLNDRTGPWIRTLVKNPGKLHMGEAKQKSRPEGGLNYHEFNSASGEAERRLVLPPICQEANATEA
jgi:hypothetical protein